MEPTAVSIQIPEDAEPGDTLNFEVSGQSLELVVPEGCLPGDVLQIQIGSDPSSHHSTTDDSLATEEEQAGGNDEFRETIQSFDMGKGKILELKVELPLDEDRGPPEKKRVKLTDKTEEAVCQVENDTENDGTFAMPWSSGVELCHRAGTIPWMKVYGLSPRRRVIEIGAGLGLVGMSFAIQEEDDVLLASDASVLLTDLPSALPLLNYNISQNQRFFNKRNVDSCALRWTLEEPTDKEKDDKKGSISKLNAPFDCILGSDLLYNVDYIPHLVATIKRLLHPTEGVVILAVRWRKPDLERAFFRDTGLKWKLLLPSQDMEARKKSSAENNETKISTRICAGCTLSWEDFGDPAKEASNRYFFQTQVSVQGVPTSLANITEEQAMNLPKEEFHAWEQAHIQIYMGTQASHNTVQK